MAGGAQSTDDEIGGINVTPFVDIALVLLIIFMVTAKYMMSQMIPVDLPQASTSQENTEQRMAAVSIDRQQALFLDGQPTTEVGLRDELRRRWESDHELRAVIAADRAVSHGRVVEVLDLVRQAGVSRFAIQSELPPEQSR